MLPYRLELSLNEDTSMHVEATYRVVDSTEPEGHYTDVQVSTNMNYIESETLRGLSSRIAKAGRLPLTVEEKAEGAR